MRGYTAAFWILAAIFAFGAVAGTLLRSVARSGCRLLLAWIHRWACLVR